MTVKALYDYDFPSADRAENFGDDQLVYVHWAGNPLFSSAAAFRVPQAMPFAEFVEAMIIPWASSDPDFDPASVTGWRLFEQPLDPGDRSKTLAGLGIVHKALVTFRA
jgi:phenol/toluene 2-monooxygenase (NADH) P4/A4